jgi:hypothetical protein
MADNHKEGPSPAPDNHHLNQLRVLPNLDSVEKQLAEFRATRLEVSKETTSVILKILARHAATDAADGEPHDQPTKLEEIEERLQQLKDAHRRGKSTGVGSLQPGTRLYAIISGILDGEKALDKQLQRLVADVNAIKV